MELAAARFPNRDGGLERGNSFGGAAFLNERLATTHGRPYRPQNGQTVLPPQPLNFFGALQQAPELTAVIERVHPIRQRKSEVERVTKAACVRFLLVVEPHCPVRVAQYPDADRAGQPL